MRTISQTRGGRTLLDIANGRLFRRDSVEYVFPLWSYILRSMIRARVFMRFGFNIGAGAGAGAGAGESMLISSDQGEREGTRDRFTRHASKASNSPTTSKERYLALE